MTRRTADLHVIELTVPAQKGAPAIVTDGSASEGCTGTEMQVIAGAAVASDGRMQIGWRETPAANAVSLYAELLAVRLGLRLATSLNEAVTLISDERTVSEQVRRAVAGLSLHVASGVDRDTRAEILTLARGRHINAVCRNGKDRPHRTAMTPLGRIAHTGAWLVRRLAADGFDPREHVLWITDVALSPGSVRANLRHKYLRYAERQDYPVSACQV